MEESKQASNRDLYDIDYVDAIALSAETEAEKFLLQGLWRRRQSPSTL